MTTPSERQERVKEIEARIAALRGTYVGTLADNMLRSLEAERYRLLQSSVGECAHSTDDGRCLFATRDWSEGCKPRRCPDCPGDTESSTPAEPNPPGSGEPVAWDYRYRYRETGAWSRWRRADTLEQAEYNGQAQTRECADIYEVRALYAAPLFSPSEGAGDLAWWRKKACDLSAENTLLRGDIITLGGEIADLKERIEDLEYAPGGPKDYNKSRTRATATGGGDNG